MKNPKRASRHPFRHTVLAVAAGVVASAALHASMPPVQAEPAAGKHMVLDEITVKRINVVDEDGTTNRLVIANGKRFPDPVIRGKQYPRSIDAAGLLFFNGQGHEVGGLALADLAQAGTTFNGLIFDFNHQPTDGIGIGRRESKDGKYYSASLTVADRLPYVPGEIKTSEGPTRIFVGNSNSDAFVVLSDTKGKPRIRLGVDKHDQPVFELLDAEGKVTKRFIEQE